LEPLRKVVRGGSRSSTSSPSTAHGGARSRRAAGPPGHRPACRGGRLKGDACAWTAKEPELFKPPTTAPSPNRTPYLYFTVLFSCLDPNRAEPGSASSALRPLRRRTSTPLPRRRVHERKVSLNPLDLVVDTAFELRLDRAM
jgi:hypothetical protein